MLIVLFSLGGAGSEIKAAPPQEPSGNSQRITHLSLEQLGNIEVTIESKEPEEVMRTPAAVFVITQDDIRRSGATSLPEILRLVPGVEVARIDSNHWSVGIRGFGGSLSSKLLVLIDGRSVYTPLYAGVYWNVQDTPLEDIERIEVIRGPGGTVWGANAVDGVINVITMDSRNTHGTRVTVGGGNLDQGTFGFRYGGGNGRDFNYRIYGKGFSRGPEFQRQSANYDDWRSGQGGFRADWTRRAEDSFTVQGDLYQEDAGEAVAYGTFSPPFQISTFGNAELAGGNLLGRWKRVLGNGSDIQLQAYYDRTNHFEPVFGETRDTFDVDFLHHMTFKRRHDFLWGAGARLSPSRFTEIVPTITFQTHQQTDKIYSGFIQDDISIVRDKLDLTVGSKLEHNNYTGFEVQPSARLMWTPSNRNSVWGSITRAVRTPSRVDEDIQLTANLLTNPLAFVEIYGNHRFFSEQLVAYEVGGRSLITPKLYLDLAAFHNNYNYLFSYGFQFASVSAQASPPPAHLLLTVPIFNGIRGSTNGFEIAPTWRVRPWWQLKGSYSYLYMDLNQRPGNMDTGNVAVYEGSSPHHQVVTQSSINLPKHFEFDQTYRYVSGLAAQTVGGYNTADARLGWKATPNWEISVAGDNLLQPHHAEFSGGGVLIKRSAYLKITWTK